MLPLDFYLDIRIHRHIIKLFNKFKDFFVHLSRGEELFDNILFYKYELPPFFLIESLMRPEYDNDDDINIQMMRWTFPLDTYKADICKDYCSPYLKLGPFVFS